MNKKSYLILFFILLCYSSFCQQEIVDVTKNEQVEYFNTTTDEIYLVKKDKPSYKYRIGFGNETSIVYYRRSFGLSHYLYANVKLVRGLNFEGGLKMMVFKYALTHFYPLTVNFFDNEVFGATFGARCGLKYHFDLLEHFGLIVGTGFTVSGLCMVAQDYLLQFGEMVPTVGLEINPDVCIGTSIPFGKYRFDICWYKNFPIDLVHYNYRNQEVTTYYNYNLNKYMSPQKFFCVSAMSVSFSFTYFFK